MAPKKSRAPRGQGADPIKTSGMITMLRYQINHGKDKSKATAAEQALKVYQELAAPDERAKFLKEFELNGGGKNQNSLKFALTFQQRLRDQIETKVSANENWWTRP